MNNCNEHKRYNMNEPRYIAQLLMGIEQSLPGMKERYRCTHTDMLRQAAAWLEHLIAKWAWELLTLAPIIPLPLP